MSRHTVSNAERASEAKRQISILDRSLAGPVASVWAQQLFYSGSGRSRVSDDGSSKTKVQPRVRFMVTKTDDAMDSVFPCVAEEWLRPIMQNKFSNPAKMNFQYASQ